MISVSLPPVEFGFSPTWPEVLEAWAFVYWSRYSTVGISTRVLQSMQNAWSVIDCTMFPRVNGVRPGFAVVRVGTADRFRVVIAIEGMASVRQIAGNLTSLDPVTSGTLQGKCVKAFNDAYVACLAAANTSTNVVAWLADPRIPKTFTGHSQGAAIAEIWALNARTPLNTNFVKLIKFGSPRVGTSDWQNNFTRVLTPLNVYVQGDPIHGIPWSNNISLAMPLFQLTGLACIYVAPFPRRLITFDGRPVTGSGDIDRLLSVRNVSQAESDPPPTNPWWEHRYENYRTVLTTFANIFDRDLEYRFRWLEYEDDNQWGQLFVPGQQFDPAWVVMAGVEPAPVDPPGNSVMQRDTSGDSVGGDWGGDLDPINLLMPQDLSGGGGDWGDALPVTETTGRRQRTRRTIQS